MSIQNQPPSAIRDQSADDLEFTTRAQDLFFDTVDHPRFASEDQTLIYNTLLSRVQPGQKLAGTDDGQPQCGAAGLRPGDIFGCMGIVLPAGG